MSAPLRIAALVVAGTLASAHAHAVCNGPGDPDCVDRLISYTGTVDFFASGASFASNTDPNDDRPNAVVQVANVVIPQRRIPPRAELLAAYLYFGGSLFTNDMDGIDSPDTTVELKVPGAADFMPVTGDQVYNAGQIPGFSEVTLYSVRAEITNLMRGVAGPLHGTYEVRGFDADIFDGNLKHTVANASFSIVLIFQEPRLSPRTIVLFDGMQEVLGSTVTLDLSGFTVSPVPSGHLTFYAQEGDCNPGPMSCDNGNNLSGAERIRVIGEDPTRSLTLNGAINPQNDIFNRTINTVDPPLKNVPGTDIDTFDITPALRAGDERVTVEITAPFPTGGHSGELIGLAYVIVGIDVFAPELRVDSRIEIRTDRGDKEAAFYPGDPLRVAYVVSNTGNLPASQVVLETHMPANVVGFMVAEEPEGAMVEVEPTGGMNGTGRVVVRNLAVRHGDGNDLVLLVETECPLPNGGQLVMSATVGAPREGGVQFALNEQVPLRKATRCGPRFFLFGGGGCETSGESGTPWTVLLLAIPFIGLVLWRRRFASLLGVLLIAGTVNLGCTPEIPLHSDDPPPPVIGVSCPGFEEMVVVPPIGTRPAFCVDRFEASPSEAGVVGNADQSGGGPRGDGSTTFAAESKRFRKPVREVSWYQANAGCQNAGKRLCTADEWVTACRGNDDLTFPYGDEFFAGRCNGYAAGRDDTVESGAMFEGVLDANGNTVAGGCVTQHGAYDMSGNVWEWNASLFLEDTRRGLAGGSFRSNGVGLRCVINDNHENPVVADDAYGFRCCIDFPFGG